MSDEHAAVDERTPLVRNASNSKQHGPRAGLRTLTQKPVLLGIAAVCVLGALTAFAVSLYLNPANALKVGFLGSFARVTSCKTCFALLTPLRQLAFLGDAPFTSTILFFCTSLRLQQAEVCRGATARQAPVLAQVLRNIKPGGRGASALCRRIFGFCTVDYGNALEEWATFNLPPPAKKHARRRQRTGKTYQMIHFTDLHVDPMYTIGAEGNCNKPLCCRNDSSTAAQIASPAGPFGHPGCDSSYALVESMLSAMKSIAPNASFVISTGDVVPHNVWLETPESVAKTIKDTYALVHGILPFQVFGSMGNHDISPTNLFPRRTSPEAFARAEWTYAAHFEAWRPSIGEDVSAEDLLTRVGCYATTKEDIGLKIISLNTNFWQEGDFYLYEADDDVLDPENILLFLIRELQDAETRGHHAIIMGHTALNLAFPAQSHMYNHIIDRYKETVVGQFFGDTHMSTFSLSYSDYDRKTAATASTISLTSGALTPYGGFANPGFRVYELDTGTGEIWDYKDYYTNMSDPHFQQGPRWQLLYSAREDLSALLTNFAEDIARQPLTPAFWHNVSEVLENSEPAFRLYMRHKYRASSFGLGGACRTAACKEAALCFMRSIRSEDQCWKDPDESPHVGLPVPKDPHPTPSSAANQFVHHHQHQYQCNSFSIFDVLRGIARA